MCQIVLPAAHLRGRGAFQTVALAKIAFARLQPERMWPRAASGRMRSHTILVVARIGAERTAPGTPHSQNTKEKTTRTGLSVNSLARSIGVTVSPSITWMAP